MLLKLGAREAANPDIPEHGSCVTDPVAGDTKLKGHVLFASILTGVVATAAGVAVCTDGCIQKLEGWSNLLVEIYSVSREAEASPRGTDGPRAGEHQRSLVTQPVIVLYRGHEEIIFPARKDNSGVAENVPRVKMLSR